MKKQWRVASGERRAGMGAASFWFSKGAGFPFLRFWSLLFLRALRGLFLCVLCVTSCHSLPAAAQQFDKPVSSIEEEITAFSVAPDGRIAYGVRHNVHNKKYDLQHDDIWIQDAGGKRRRILEGNKFSINKYAVFINRDKKSVAREKGKLDPELDLSDTTFSYTVDSLRWSPNGKYLLAQLFTTFVVDESGRTQDEYMTLVMDDSGKEIRLGGNDPLLHNAEDAIFFTDNATIAYLTEATKPRILFSFKYSTIANGTGGALFEGRTFLSVVPIPKTNFAIAIERDKALSGPPRLQHLDLLAQEDSEIATLEGYEGGLTVSPSGRLAAYYVDKENVEVRDLATPTRVARIRLGPGVLQWSPNETKLLLKRALERKSAELCWIPIPELATPAAGREIPVAHPDFNPLFRGSVARDFAITPDGKHLAIIFPGKRNLDLFSMQ
ncbi:MAG: hypothetical protein JSS69_15870 [Acidobacteria bacterium]|nr:hypothetical protein [Acidobacteriota bacterium]MBS1867392.1 hypothetical protein [Acidobacteriota bacterium]